MQSNFEKIVNTKPKRKGHMHRKNKEDLREAKRTRRDVKRSGRLEEV